MSKFREIIEEKDSLAVRRLLESSSFFSQAEVNMVVEKLLRSFDQQKKQQVSDFAYRHIFLEAKNGAESKLLAYVCYQHIPCTSYSYELYWFAVDDQQRGLGLGKQMLRYLEDKIVNHFEGRQLYVKTAGRPQYIPTNEFYLKNGYEQVAYLRDYYSPGDPQIIYVKYF